MELCLCWDSKGKNRSARHGVHLINKFILLSLTYTQTFILFYCTKYDYSRRGHQNQKAMSGTGLCCAASASGKVESLCGFGEYRKSLLLPQALFFFFTVSVFKICPAVRKRDDFTAA